VTLNPLTNLTPNKCLLLFLLFNLNTWISSVRALVLCRNLCLIGGAPKGESSPFPFSLDYSYSSSIVSSTRTVRIYSSTHESSPYINDSLLPLPFFGEKGPIGYGNVALRPKAYPGAIFHVEESTYVFWEGTCSLRSGLAYCHWEQFGIGGTCSYEMSWRIVKENTTLGT
jgi:hypothetical protein